MVRTIGFGSERPPWQYTGIGREDRRHNRRGRDSSRQPVETERGTRRFASPATRPRRRSPGVPAMPRARCSQTQAARPGTGRLSVPEIIRPAGKPRHRSGPRPTPYAEDCEMGGSPSGWVSSPPRIPGSPPPELRACLTVAAIPAAVARVRSCRRPAVRSSAARAHRRPRSPRLAWQRIGHGHRQGQAAGRARVTSGRRRKAAVGRPLVPCTLPVNHAPALS